MSASSKATYLGMGMEEGIQPGTKVIITNDILIEGVVAFSKGEEVCVEQLAPNSQRPEFKYVVLSKNLQKRFQLSDANLQKGPARCSNCGKRLKDGTKFCTYCGTGLQVELGHPASSSAFTEPKALAPDRQETQPALSGDRAHPPRQAYVVPRPSQQEISMAGLPVTPRLYREQAPIRHSRPVCRQSRPKKAVAIVTIACFLLVVSLITIFLLGNRSWIDTGEASGASTLTSLASNGTNLYAGGDDGHVYSYDGTNWNDTGGPAGGMIHCLACGGTNLYAGTDSQGVYRYDGSTWFDMGRPGEMYPGVFCLAWNGTYIYAGGSSEWVYYYDGTSWIVAGGRKSSPGGGGYLSSLTWNGTSLYSGGDNGHVYRYDGTYWTYTGGPAVDTEQVPGGVWSLSSNGTSLYAGVGDGHVYRYDGTSWTDMGNLDRPDFAQAVASVTSNGTSLFAAVDDYHVYRYSGSTWVDTSGPVGKTKDAPGANSLVWNGANLYVGCYNGHVYRYGGGH